MIDSLPSYAHGSESHRPKKEMNILKKPNLQNPDNKIDNKNMRQNATMEENNVMSEEDSEIINLPAIAEEANSTPLSTSQPISFQATGTMPQGLGETLSVLLVAFPVGLYALKHR